MRYFRRASCFLRLLILGALFGMGAASAAPFAYVSNNSSNNVSVIDTASNTVVATVPVGTSPYGVAVNPGGTFAYVTNTGSNTVSVINTISNTVVATVPVGAGPKGVALNPADALLYVANFDDNTVSVISTVSNTVVHTVPLGPAPFGVAVDAAGTYAYVTSGSSEGSVSLIFRFSIWGAVGFLETSPTGVAVNPAGTFAYAAMSGSNTVAVITAGFQPHLVAFVPVGAGPLGIAVHPAGTFAYVANEGSNTVSVIDTATNTVVATVPVGTSPKGVAVNPAGTFVYVANSGSANVSVIDTATNTIVTTVSVGADPVAFGNFIGPAPGLGESSNLVYKPLEPCRIMDTRNATYGSGVQGPVNGPRLFSLPGFITAGSDWSQYGQTGTLSDCGLTNPPGSAIRAIALVITILNPNFDAFLGVNDAGDLDATLSTVALNYIQGQGLSTLYFVPQVASNNIYFALPAGLSAQLIFDVVGYFVVSDATALQCTTQSSVAATIGAGSTGSATSPACGAGYALTSGSCDSDSFNMKLVADKASGQAWACSANNLGGSPAHLTATANCCGVPGK